MQRFEYNTPVACSFREATDNGVHSLVRICRIFVDQGDASVLVRHGSSTHMVAREDVRLADEKSALITQMKGETVDA